MSKRMKLVTEYRYEDIQDWIEMNFYLQDKRLVDLQKVFSMLVKKFRLELFRRGLKLVKRDDMSMVYSTLYGQEVVLTPLQERIKKDLLGTGIFSVVMNYKNFPGTEVSFYIPEDLEMAKFQDTLEYFLGNPEGYYGPSQKDLSMHKLRELLIQCYPSVYDQKLMNQMQRRIDLIGLVIEFHTKLTKVDSRVDEVFNGYQEQIVEDLIRKKETMYFAEYQRYEKQIKENFISLQRRFYMVGDIVTNKIYN